VSVCVVAEYPFPSDKIVGGTPYGVVVCTDTKITRPGRAIKLLAAKQRPVSENILVCYTSSNFPVTTTALNVSTERRACLKRLGRNLHAHHGKWGGLTELLAVVWHRDKVSPTVLELMPTKYEPRVRNGIVGIGDRDVLARFRELLDSHFESDKAEIPMTLEALEGLSKAMGGPLNFNFTQAVLNGATPIAAALDQAVTDVQSPYCGTPIVVHFVIPKTGVLRWGA
jgi:hypothetical protein